jgi:hypothetical protein
VPVRSLDPAATMAHARECPAGFVRALLVCWRILIQIGALCLEIGKFFVAFIAKKQRFAAVADKHKGIVGYWDSLHGVLDRHSTFTYVIRSFLSDVDFHQGGNAVLTCPDIDFDQGELVGRA